MKMRCFLLAVLLVIFCFTWSAWGAQYSTDFKYKDINDFSAAGWGFGGQGISFSNKGVTLDGIHGVTSIYYGDVPKNVEDWKAGVKGTWLGGKGNSYINVQVATKKHNYTFGAEGYTGMYILIRDGKRVIEDKSYHEAVNALVTLYLEKTGKSIILYAQGKQIAVYTEEESAPVISVAICSPNDSAALYSWAGAFIPESSSESPTGQLAPPVVEEPSAIVGESPAGWDGYSVLQLQLENPVADNQAGLQQNPGQDLSTESIQNGENIPPPPVPEEILTDGSESSVPQNNNSGPIDIVVNPCIFSINTGENVADYGAEAEASSYIFDGVCQQSGVHVSEASMQVYCQQQQALFDAGMIAPETHIHDYEYLAGNKPSYYVDMNTHLSGDFSSEATANAAVGIFKATVTDGAGKVVFSQTITAVASEGHSVDYYHCQLAQQVNMYLQSVIISRTKNGQ